MTTKELHDQIREYQRLQSTMPFSNPQKQILSDKLAPLFAEMDRRKKAGDEYAQTASHI